MASHTILDKQSLSDSISTIKCQKLNQLPSEIFLLQILPYFTRDELCSFRFVNRHFAQVAVQNFELPQKFHLGERVRPLDPDSTLFALCKKFPVVCDIYREIELFPRQIFSSRNTEYNFDSNSTKQDLALIEILRSKMPRLERMTVDFKNTRDGGAISPGTMDRILEIFSEGTPLKELTFRHVPLWFFSKVYNDKTFASLKTSLSACESFNIDIVTCEHGEYASPYGYEDDDYLLADWSNGVNTGCFCDGSEMTRLQLMSLRVFLAALSANQNLKKLEVSWIKGDYEEFSKGNRNIICRCVPEPFLPLFKLVDLEVPAVKGGYRVPPHEFVALDVFMGRDRFPKKSYPKYGSFGSALVPPAAKELFCNISFPQVVQLKVKNFYVLDTNCFNTSLVTAFPNVEVLEFENAVMWHEKNANSLWSAWALGYRQLMMELTQSDHWRLRRFSGVGCTERSPMYYTEKGWLDGESTIRTEILQIMWSTEGAKVDGEMRAMLFGPLE